MKKFSLKFIVISILFLFSSFIYANGVFSKYYNGRFYFSIDVPITKYENGMGENVKLDFIKNSTSIPSKNFFSAYEAGNSDGLTIKDKSENITILAYGTNFLNSEEVNGLEDTENIKESFKNDNLNYNEFIKKYYNGKFPKNINALKYEYNKTLFIYGENVAYNTIGKDFYVVSYIEDNKIIYRKVIYNKDENSYAIFEASYLPKDKKFMDNIVNEMVKSFKIIK
ncbi:hypothetical protein KST80_12275 [Fusobacterium polymorphum]|uniref:Uncharacterized protein n=1 Tax=Fusobacterium nucleatum subsp. polymorphum TaxID=76857 RepID=A0A2C6BKT3_FUSNP|nr:hypothetical protein [Fusobacterium polymorphum]PHI07375.1 hypothetical protein CBG54_10415 [Fusobacterium polymorphum]PHI14969.1 hypothetical protein CBG58_08685 [Fusobacterium polymorphum]